MKQITVGFSKACTFFPIFSWLIMLTEGTPYSHVYIKVTDTEAKIPLVYQASHSFVNSMGETMWASQETVIQEFNFQVSDVSYQKIKAFSIAQLGVPYGVLSIVGLAWVQMLKCVGISATNPFRDNGQTYVCSQFVSTILESCENVSISENINNITPKDLFAIVQKLPQVLSVD